MSKLASVLIVDDNPRCLEFMTQAFSAQGGVNVSSEMKPITALDRIRVEKPDLVVLDVKMPDLDGFGVLSLNGGWKIREGVQLTAGVDNLLDETYAEHISRGGAMLAGFTQTERVNEPGRTAWMKLSLVLD